MEDFPTSFSLKKNFKATKINTKDDWVKIKKVK